MNTTATQDWPQPRTIKVFLDNPVWDAHSKWWMVPMHVIQSLFVCTYDTDEEQFYDHLEIIEKTHPECVFVY